MVVLDCVFFFSHSRISSFDYIYLTCRIQCRWDYVCTFMRIVRLQTVFFPYFCGFCLELIKMPTEYNCQPQCMGVLNVVCFNIQISIWLEYVIFLCRLSFFCSFQLNKEREQRLLNDKDFCCRFSVVPMVPFMSLTQVSWLTEKNLNMCLYLKGNCWTWNEFCHMSPLLVLWFCC